MTPKQGQQDVKRALDNLEQGIVAAAKRIGTDLPIGKIHDEWGVIFLLGAIAKDAGFSLLKGQNNEYPDAWLAVNVGGARKEIRAELEYRSSSFKHHDPSGCDVMICWRKNRVFGDLRIIELYPLFPECDDEQINREIDHKQMDPALQDAFALVRARLVAWGLAEKGTGARGKTYTKTYKSAAADGVAKSLCSLQYDVLHGRLQFKWFKGELRRIHREEAFVESLLRLPKLVPTTAAAERTSETRLEYRINVFPQDESVLDVILEQVGVVFAR